MNTKVREHLLSIALLFTLLNSCSGMPIGDAEILPMSSQQVVSGVYEVFSGQQKISFMFQHTSGLRIIFWPGASNGSQVLWNIVCLEQCPPNWEHFVVSNGFSATWQRASEFAAYLRAGGWHQVPLAAASAGYSSVKSWLDLMASSLTGFFIVVPVIMPVQPTEIRS
jgi:hypothetical protein